MKSHFFRTRRLGRALLTMGVLVVLVWWSPGWLMRPIAVAGNAVLWPFEKVFSWVAFETDDMVRFFLTIGALKSDNERLIRENLRLSAQNASLTENATENETLRNELKLLPTNRFSFLSASVIGRDDREYGNWLSIDRGSLNGIRVGMPVIVDGGTLVGLVDDVTPTSSHIKLLSHPESVVNVNVAGSLTRGVARGDYGLGILFDRVLQTDTFKAGDTVVTSGLGGDIPSGLLVGTLLDPRASPDHLFQQAGIFSPVRYSSLRFVFVITGNATH